MVSRTKAKKISIIIVLALFLVVTMGSFVMYLFSDKVQAPSPNTEVQPSVVVPSTSTGTATTGTIETVNTETTVNNG